MSDLRELYQEVILDHSRQPRHFRVLEPADARAEGHNPLCGDRITVFLRVSGDRVREVAFQGSGCAISMASASMMAQAVHGATRSEIDAMYRSFHELVTGRGSLDAAPAGLGKLAVFAGVCKFPVRVKCSTLCWHTLRAALEQRADPVSTEHDPAGQAGQPGAPPAAAGQLRQRVIEVLRTCYDPEIPVDIYELGLIYEVRVEPGDQVAIKMTLTSPMCPVAGSLPGEVETKVRALEGVADARVELVWDPPWDKEMMTEAAKVKLGFF